MGKAVMCIKMLQYLNTGKVFKVSELAQLLNTNPRNIIEYKKELDELAKESDFKIETLSGRYGGYRLNGTVTLPTFKFFTEEKLLLDKIYNYILEKNDFEDLSLVTKVYNKLLSFIKVED